MIIYIAAGSALGGALRYLVGGLIQDRFGSGFPIGTLLINVSGSFLLLFIMEFALSSSAVSAETRGFLTVGLCGGFTTFSTFSYETLRLIQDGDYRRASLYVALSVAGALAGAVAGQAVARGLVSSQSSL